MHLLNEKYNGYGAIGRSFHYNRVFFQGKSGKTKDLNKFYFTILQFSYVFLLKHILVKLKYYDETIVNDSLL